MARLFIFLNIFFALIANTTSLTEHNAKPKPGPKQKPHNFVIPVSKDTKSGLYYTNVTIGQPPLVTTLVVDIIGSALHLHCKELGYNTTSYTPVLCKSPDCDQPEHQCSVGCEGPLSPTCRNGTCEAWDVYSDLAYTSGPHFLLNDDMTPSPSYKTSPSAPKIGVRARIACVSEFQPLKKLPYGAKGILGLANSSMSFVTNLVSSHKIPFKVALCLPSKPDGVDYGAAYIGGGPYSLPPNGEDVTGLLVSTSLLQFAIHGGESDSYHIDVKSIQVNGKRISFNQTILDTWGNARINYNLIPYTRLETSIYKALVKAFAGKAQKRNAVAPFTDCFSYKSFGGKSLLGKEIPVISFVLGGGVKWDIYGPNSLVKVKKTVVCLAFVDAGNGPYTPIEIGGYQVEDNLIEFDLEASKFSFTSSLLLHNTSCSRPLW